MVILHTIELIFNIFLPSLNRVFNQNQTQQTEETLLHVKMIMPDLIHNYKLYPINNVEDIAVFSTCFPAVEIHESKEINQITKFKPLISNSYLTRQSF